MTNRLTVNKKWRGTKLNYYKKLASDMIEYRHEWKGNQLIIHYSDSEPDINGVDKRDFEEFLKTKLFSN